MRESKFVSTGWVDLLGVIPERADVKRLGCVVR
jgi:hypothetical protein